jgi:hypothetical protein|tara:strand:- start:3408 stop:4145 length:738 start_codon:yes stop_codon:yes gene_type:complete
MANPKVSEASSILLSELGNIGPILGPIMIIISLFLMFKGHERLQLVAGITGAGIGFVLTPLAYTQIAEFDLEIRQLYIMMLLILVCGGIMSATIQMSIRIMAGFVIYISFAGLFEFLQGRGFEVVESELIQGTMAIVAFFSVRWMRNILPIFVSALMGSLGVMGGMLLVNGSPLTLMTTSNNSTLMMILVLFTLSFLWQYKEIKHKKKQQNLDPKLPQMQQVSAGGRVNTRKRKGGDLPDLRDFS